MNGSNVSTAAIPCGRRAKAVAIIGLSGLLGLGFAGIFQGNAEAQYFPFPWRYPYYDGYPPPVPPGEVAAGETPRGYEPNATYGVLPLAEIRRRIAFLGFHLIATPRHKDRIYLAEVEDVHGLRRRLVFDAYEGEILENTKLPGHKRAMVRAVTAAVGTEKKDAQASGKSAPSNAAPVTNSSGDANKK